MSSESEQIKSVTAVSARDKELGNHLYAPELHLPLDVPKPVTGSRKHNDWRWWTHNRTVSRIMGERMRMIAKGHDDDITPLLFKQWLKDIAGSVFESQYKAAIGTVKGKNYAK
jgi:hypothetical protein